MTHLLRPASALRAWPLQSASHMDAGTRGVSPAHVNMSAACTHLLRSLVLVRECTCDRLVQEGEAISASCSAGFRGPLLQQVHLSGLGLAAP